METKIINLDRYQNKGIFTGRPQGESARADIGLDNIENNSNSLIVIEIPENTTSFTPSFYLGLLFPSYSKFGLDGFEKKFSFKLLTQDEEIKKVITNDLLDGRRSAMNALAAKSGLDYLLTKRK